MNAAVARMPAGAPVLHELLACIDLATLPDSEWGSVNPTLFTEMLTAFELTNLARPAAQAFPVPYWEFEKLFLPTAREEVEEACRDAMFVHLWNDRMRRSGVPKWIAPPVGSYLDALFRRFDIRFPSGDSLPAEQIAKWSANLRSLDAERSRAAQKEREVQHLRREMASLTARIGMLEAERTALASRGALGPDLSRSEAARRRP